MATYLLTWNPRKYSMDWAAEAGRVRESGFARFNWSTGRRKRIEPGD